MDQLALLHQNQFLIENALLKLYSILDIVGEGCVSPENLKPGENAEAEAIIVVVTDEEAEENIHQVVQMEEDKRDGHKNAMSRDVDVNQIKETDGEIGDVEVVKVSENKGELETSVSKENQDKRDGHEKAISRDMDVNQIKEADSKIRDVVVAKVSENEGELETYASREKQDPPGELGEKKTTIDKTEDNGEGEKEEEHKEEPKLPGTEVSSLKWEGDKDVEPGEKKETESKLQKEKMANRPKISRNDRRVTRGSRTLENLAMSAIEKDVHIPKGHGTPLKDISNVQQIREVDGTREKKSHANDSELKSAISEIVKNVGVDMAIDVGKRKGDNKWAVEVAEECEKEDEEKCIKKRPKRSASCIKLDADKEVKPMEKKVTESNIQKEKVANKPVVSTERPVTRGRKSMLVMPSLEEITCEELHIEKGCGTAIKDISNGRYLSRKKTSDAFELLNKILLERKRDKVEINISKFSGFDNEEKEIIKVENKLRKCLKAVLLELCVALGIPLPERKDSFLKENFVAMLLDYLMEPHATNSDLLAEKDQRNGENKEHAIWV